MTASKHSLSLVALLALAPSLAWAQGNPTETERLRAENAVLRLELRKLRRQFTDLEERMGRAGFELGPDPTPAPAPSPTEDARHGLSEDGRTLWLDDLRLRPERGAASPEELAAAWTAALFAGKEGEDLSGMTRFHAFLKGRFLVPSKLWQSVRGGANARPAEGQLGLSYRTLQPLLKSGRLLGVEVGGFVSPATDERVQSAAGVRNLYGLSSNGEEGLAVNVLANSPLARAGVSSGDFLDSISTPTESFGIRSADDLTQALRRLGGQEVTIGFRAAKGEKGGPPGAAFYSSATGKCRLTAFGSKPAPTRRVLCRLDTKATTHEVQLEVLNLEGRWLVLSATVTTIPEVIRRSFERLGEAMVLELDASEATRKKTSRLVTAAFKVLEEQIPLYEFTHLETGKEFGLIATPRQAGYPRVTFGYTGRLDPRKYPYRARLE